METCSGFDHGPGEDGFRMLTPCRKKLSLVVSRKFRDRLNTKSNVEVYGMVWNIRQPYEDALDSAAALTIGGVRANTTDI